MLKLAFSRLALLVLVAASASGCAARPLPVADPSVARDGLKTALDTWQSGATADTLAQRSPAIYVADDDWHRGARLVKYQLLGDGDTFGTNHCCQVQLSLVNQAGKAVEKKVWYSVGTGAAIAISREDRRRGDS